MKSELTIQETLLRRTLPIVINSFNQLHYLKNLLERMQADGFINFVILDNKSEYPPLLDYYKELEQGSKATIIYYGENRGPHFFHMKGLYKLFASLPHIYTDPDMSYESLAPNFLTELIYVSEKYSMFKVGPALEIPLPGEANENIYAIQNGKKVGIAEWESQFWQKQIEPGLYYPGQIDTTFHLFNPRHFKIGAALIDGIRIGKEGFVFKHLPWYSSSNNVPIDELRFYESTANEKNTWKTAIN